MVASQTAVNAEQSQREDAGELADIADDVRHFARHLTQYTTERPTVTE